MRDKPCYRPLSLAAMALVAALRRTTNWRCNRMAIQLAAAIARVYKLCKYRDVHRCYCMIYWHDGHRRCFAARRRQMAMRRKVHSGTGSSMCGMLYILLSICIFYYSNLLITSSISSSSSTYIYIQTYVWLWHSRSLADTAATSMVTINTHGEGDDRHFAAKQSKVKNRRKGK